MLIGLNILIFLGNINVYGSADMRSADQLKPLHNNVAVLTELTVPSASQLPHSAYTFQLQCMLKQKTLGT